MHTIFLWFYCLPIADAVILIVLTTAIFLLLRNKFRDVRYWKAGIPFLLLCWITAILFCTLGQRADGGHLTNPVLMPFHSYYAVLQGGSQELYRANFMNTALFYPVGLLGCELLPKGWKKLWKAALVICVFMMLSIGIEYIQYRFGLGLAETDDVIHNTLGTLLGVLVCNIQLNWIKDSIA